MPHPAESVASCSSLVSDSSPLSESSLLDCPSNNSIDTTCSNSDGTSSSSSRSGSTSSSTDSLSDLELVPSGSQAVQLTASLDHSMCSVGGAAVDLFSGPLFNVSLLDLDYDDIFMDLFDGNVHRFMPPGPVLP